MTPRELDMLESEFKGGMVYTDTVRKLGLAAVKELRDLTTVKSQRQHIENELRRLLNAVRGEATCICSGCVDYGIELARRHFTVAPDVASPVAATREVE